MGWAARAHGVACTIVVPLGNSVEKNAAMRALGVTLIEYGDDFQAAREFAINLANERSAHMVPSFHPDLIRGVATYGWNFFFKAVPTMLCGGNVDSGVFAQVLADCYKRIE